MYFPLLPSIFTKVNEKKEEGRSGTTGTGVSQKDLQRGERKERKKRKKSIHENHFLFETVSTLTCFGNYP